jgi:hypothetical protein
MIHTASLRIAIASSAFVLAVACQSHAVDLPQDRPSLISACKAEAASGHIQGSLAQRREHIRKMSAICEEWRTVRKSDRDALVARCLAEAGQGPSIGHRKYSTNQSHKNRQKALCRNLAES